MDILNEPVTYREGAAYLGSGFTIKPIFEDYIGALKTIDPDTGEIKWKYHNDAPLWGGVMTTAGGLIFPSTPDGAFKALDDETGEELWSFQTGSGIVGQPITWEQYVTVVPLWGGEVANRVNYLNQGGTVWTFRLPKGLVSANRSTGTGQGPARPIRRAGPAFRACDLGGVDEGATAAILTASAPSGPCIMLANPIVPQARTFQTALIVDDHPLFCDALSMTLRAVSGIGRTEMADSLAAALERIGSGDVDLVVLDLNLPDVSGLDGLLRLKAAVRSTPVVVVSSITDQRMIASAIRAGAAGFVPKHSQREVFRRAMETIAAGGTYVPEGITLDDGPESTANDDAIQRLSQLTRQQARILELICEGKLNKQIAYELSIADATVKAHVTAIMRKLGVQTRTQAVLLAREVSFATILHD